MLFSDRSSSIAWIHTRWFKRPASESEPGVFFFGRRRTSEAALRSPDCAGDHQHVERTLDYPDSCNQNNQRRAAEENNLSIERRPAKEERDRQERADYHQLPGLNAEVETDERERERTLRQAELLQDIREAQAVDESE